MIRRGRQEGWLKLPATALTTWAKFNGASFDGVQVSELPGRGCGVVAQRNLSSEDASSLITVPRDLVLSLESVEQSSRVDKTLGDLLAGLDDFGTTTRGAILTFLLCQATLSCPDVASSGFVRTPLADYVKLLPLNDLPTSWTDIPDIALLLTGTTLAPALSAKMNFLRREFDAVRESSSRIPWCVRNWWKEGPAPSAAAADEEAKMKKLLESLGDERDSDEEGQEATETAIPEAADGLVTFDDWLQVDCFYRSRALEFPGIGDAMVPVLDMANHAGGDATAALYETDSEGSAVLLLREGKRYEPGDEITITYGDAKGACEMLFSYGFIEDSMTDARELFLELDMPQDDPLAMAKKHVSKSPPGFKISRHQDGSIVWDGAFIWLVVANEEDGLDFAVLQTNSGAQELRVSWRGRELLNVENDLRSALEADGDMWDVFQLRAIATLRARVEVQLQDLSSSQQYLNIHGQGEASRPLSLIRRLRNLEKTLLENALAAFESQQAALMDSPSVVRYLSKSQGDDAYGDDDFS